MLDCREKLYGYRSLQFGKRPDPPKDSAGHHRWWACEPYAARPAATGEVAVDGADRDLRGIGRGAWPAIGAGTAGRLQDLRADLLECSEITACNTVIANVHRAELQKQLHIGRDARCKFS